jgi:chromosome segregation ATPase
MNEVKIELEFMRETHEKSEQKYKESQAKLEDRDRRVYELERECKNMLSQIKEDKQDDLKMKMRAFKNKLRSQIGKLVQDLKQQQNQYKLDIVQDVLNLKKDSFGLLSKIVPQIENDRQNLQQKAVQYHEKNTKKLQLLQTELESRTSKSEELENENSHLVQKLNELDIKVNQLTCQLSEAEGQNQGLEREYRSLLQTIDEKNKEIHVLKFDHKKKDKEEEAIKLTEIITSEIQKKYKEKLVQVMQLFEQSSNNHKSKIELIEGKNPSLA